MKGSQKFANCKDLQENLARKQMDKGKRHRKTKTQDEMRLLLRQVRPTAELMLPADHKRRKTDIGTSATNINNAAKGHKIYKATKANRRK